MTATAARMQVRWSGAGPTGRCPRPGQPAGSSRSRASRRRARTPSRVEHRDSEPRLLFHELQVHLVHGHDVVAVPNRHARRCSSAVQQRTGSRFRSGWRAPGQRPVRLSTGFPAWTPISSRTLRTTSMPCPARVGKRPVFVGLPRKTGQASPQTMVMAQRDGSPCLPGQWTPLGCVWLPGISSITTCRAIGPP